MIGSAATMEGQRLDEIPVKDIKPNPRQPRKRFDAEALDQMARSIEEFGVVQPVVVRPVGTEYELVAGERRWRAAQQVGLEKIPAIIKRTTETDSLEMALIENLHRSDLNSIEEANAYQQLLEDFAITHEELSRKVGKSRTTITNTLRLLQLPPSIQREVVETRISAGHARTLLALQGKPALQEEICSRIIEEGLSVRQVEELCGVAEPRPAEEAAPVGSAAPRQKQPLPEEVQEILDRVSEALDARTKGVVGKRKGRLVIEFRGIDDLRRIAGLMGAGADPEPGEEDAGPEALGREAAAEPTGAGSPGPNASGPASTESCGESPFRPAPSNHWT